MSTGAWGFRCDRHHRDQAGAGKQGAGGGGIPAASWSGTSGNGASAAWPASRGNRSRSALPVRKPAPGRTLRRPANPATSLTCGARSSTGRWWRRSTTSARWLGMEQPKFERREQSYRRPATPKPDPKSAVLGLPDRRAHVVARTRSAPTALARTGGQSSSPASCPAASWRSSNTSALGAIGVGARQHQLPWTSCFILVGR